MDVIIGFGDIEKDEREKIRHEMQKRPAGEVLDEWNNKADEYDAMPRETAPERYTRFWYYGDQLHYHHINRRHAMSPDGWALLKVIEDFKIDELVA